VIFIRLTVAKVSVTVVLKDPSSGWWSASVARLNSENLQLIRQAYGDDARWRVGSFQVVEAL
jgi:hypothetical protein